MKLLKFGWILAFAGMTLGVYQMVIRHSRESRNPGKVQNYSYSIIND